MIRALGRFVGDAIGLGATLAREVAAAVLGASGEEVSRPARSRSGDGADPEPRAPAEEDPAAAFAALLERSRDPKRDEEHPAFREILRQLSPDEARVLVLFARRDTHPIVHVRALPKIGFGQTLVLENFSLIGEEAGCHHPERAPEYVENLARLGLVRVHSERGEDPGAYELLEIHPRAKAAARRIRGEMGQRVRFDRRVVRLTAFGRRFCDACRIGR